MGILPAKTEQSILRHIALGKTAKITARLLDIPAQRIYDTLAKYHLSARLLRKQLRQKRRHPPNLRKLNMATIDFDNLLSQPMDTIKRPPVKPAGTYNATISEYKFGRSAKKGTPFCEFLFSGVTAGDDVDPDQLKDNDGKPIDLSKWKPNFQFYLTPDSAFRLTEFIKALEIPTVGRTLNEAIPETRGLPVLLTVSMKATEDGSGFFNRIEGVTAAK